MISHTHTDAFPCPKHTVFLRARPLYTATISYVWRGRRMGASIWRRDVAWLCRKSPVFGRGYNSACVWVNKENTRGIRIGQFEPATAARDRFRHLWSPVLTQAPGPSRRRRRMHIVAVADKLYWLASGCICGPILHGMGS